MTPVERLVAWWEGLDRERLAGIASVYAPDAYFRDPFHEVRGPDALRRVLEPMFDRLEGPRFRVLEVVAQGEGAVLVWDFDFRIRAWRPGEARRIHGVSHVRFAPDGRVAYHRDYWDAAGELYAQLPLLGPVARFLARRFAGG